MIYDLQTRCEALLMTERHTKRSEIETVLVVRAALVCVVAKYNSGRLEVEQRKDTLKMAS